MFRFFKKRSAATPTSSISIESQLASLENAGIKLAENRTVEELLISWDRADYESEPFRLLLSTLGGEVEEEPWERYFSNDIWRLDAECIEGNESYAYILYRMKMLAGSGFDVSNVSSQLDLESQSAELRFDFHGEAITLVPEVNDDWIDPKILSNISLLTQRAELNGGFTYLDLGGQDCLIGFATKEELRMLNELGLGFIWLK